MSAPTAPLPLLSGLTPLAEPLPLGTATAQPRVPVIRTSGIVLAVTSAFAFSSSGPLLKPLMEAGWSLSAVLLVRMALAAIVLSPALVVALRRDPGILVRHGHTIVGFGLTGVAGCQLFYFAAMQRMPVAVALLIQYLAPVLLVLFTWVRTRKAPAAIVIVGTAVAIVGLVLVVDISGATFDLIGSLLALGAAVCVAFYFVIADRASDAMPPMALASSGVFVGVIFVAVLAAVGLLPLHVAFVDVTVAGVSAPWWLLLLWVGAVATAAGYGLGVAAVPRVGARLASFLGLSEVLFALMFAALLLGELPHPIQYLGGALLLTGVVLVRLDRSRPQ